GCLRYELGTCLGPCIGTCTRQAYLQRVRAAERFLSGADLSLLDGLKRDMLTAATTQAFERAAALRDKWEVLNWLQERLAYVRNARGRQSFVYRVNGHEGDELWYLIRGGCVTAAVPAPTDRKDRKAVRDLIRRVYQTDRRSDAPVPADEI